jgi:hypothetical protein
MKEEAQALVEKIKIELKDGKSDEEIFQSILHLFGKGPESDSQLIELLSGIPHVKIVNILHRMLRVSREKKVRKIIKRSLYRLRSKGIAVEEVLPEKKSSILRPLQTESPKGFGGGFDFLGQRFLLLVIPHTGRGWTVMQGVISDTEGMVDFSGEEMARKRFRGFFEEVQEKSPFPLVEIEPSYVAFLFLQAYQLTLEKKRIVPQDYLSFKNEIEGVKKDYKRPLIYSLLQADEIAADDRILQRVGELFKADVISSWRIEEDRIRPYADEVREAEESKIVLNQTQKEARFQGIYQKALTELFGSERRFLYHRRLEEMAYIFFKLGKEEEARISLAVAIDLEKPVNPIQPNPFLFQLVVRSIFTLLKESYEQKAEEPSLIVKP